MKLSPTQKEAVKRMVRTRQPLERWRGGFWTTKGTPVSYTENTAFGLYAVPEWHIGMKTVLALEKKHIIKRLHVHAESWRDERGI